MRTLDALGSSSPSKHRTSIVPTSSASLDTTLEGSDIEMAGGASSHLIQHQQSLDSSAMLGVRSTVEPVEPVDIVAEPLSRILEHKTVREKRLEMEKKLESLRKKHDKEKIRVTTQRSGDLSESIRMSKFYSNKLVKRLSSKNL